MARNTVRIERMHLRVPGLTRDEARGLGEQLAQKISESLPVNGRRERLGAMRMKVTLRRETPRDQIASLAARAIVEKLR